MILPPHKPIIYLLTKGESTPANFDETSREILDLIRIAVEEKISLVQIREKLLPARLLFDLTVKAADITRGSETRLLVNDRADIAFAAGADGVHLTANSLPVDVIRRSLPNDIVVGVSTHSFDAAAEARRTGADFAVFGPIFETPGKDGSRGIEKLAEICDKLKPFPILPLGGVDESNIASVMDAGAAGFAAIRMLNDPASLKTVCRRYK